MNRAIVNCAIGESSQRKCPSMRWHVRQHAGDADLLLWDDYPPGCPPQVARQYAFKAYAIADAIQRGYRRVLWMDCVFMPQRSLEPVWDRIEREGWWVPPQESYRLHEWISDDCLRIMGMTRDGAEDVPLVYSGLVGLNLDHSTGVQIWDQWRWSYRQGAWDGPHVNKPGEPIGAWGSKFQGHCSHDPRCRGHRHDESALSIILYQMGLTPEYAGLLGPGCPIEMHVPLPLDLAETAGKAQS